MGDQNITALPKKTSSQMAATDYLLGIDSEEGYQMLIQDLGDYIIQHATSSLAGSNQTLAAAVNALNSKTNLIWRYTSEAIDGNALDDGCIISSAASGHTNLAQNNERCIVITYTLVASVRKVQIQYTMTDAYKRILGGNGWTSWEKLPTREEMDTSYSLTKGTGIPSGSDMDTYSTPGMFTVMSDTIANSIQNCPVGKAGVLVVEYPIRSNDYYIMQSYYTYDKKDRYVRMKTKVSAWTAWELQPTRAEVDALNNKVTCIYGNYTFTNGFTELQNAAILTTSKIFVEISRNDGSGYTWNGITTSIQITGNGTARIFIRKPDGTVPSDTMVTMQILIVN